MSEQTIIPPSKGDTPFNADFAYARFMDRLIALIIDQIILYVGKFVILFPLLLLITLGGFLAMPPVAAAVQGAGMTPSMWALSMIVDWLYFAVMESSPRGATIGKRAMKLRVLTEKGERLSFGRASLRFVSKILSYIPLMLGFIMALFTKRRQALHDLIADTIVVDIEG